MTDDPRPGGPGEHRHTGDYREHLREARRQLRHTIDEAKRDMREGRVDVEEGTREIEQAVKSFRDTDWAEFKRDVGAGDTSKKERRKRRESQRSKVFGAVLLVIGAGWLMGELDVIDAPWQAILAAAMIVLGAGMVWASKSGSHGPLIFWGIALGVVLTASTTVQVPIQGGVGEAFAAPTTVEDLRDGYTLALGSLTIDLGGLELAAGTTRVEGKVNVGELVVILPADVPVKVDGRVGIGNLDTPAGPADASGVRFGDTVVLGDYDQAVRRIFLDVAVGIGNIEVRYAAD